jgi:hypothetical protein
MVTNDKYRDYIEEPLELFQAAKSPPGSNPLWDFRRVRTMLPEMGFKENDFDQVFYPAWNLRNIRKQWIKAHSISYSWVGDELLPNPDFKWPLPVS